jgi:hypothetical protein
MGSDVRRYGREPGERRAGVAPIEPVVTAPIIGPRTIEPVNDTLRTLEITLDTETLKKIDDIFPAVGCSATNRSPRRKPTLVDHRPNRAVLNWTARTVLEG